jgi:hypothetical protein
MADPTRVVADADVLVADLLVGGQSREAIDHLRRHSWTTLVASEALLEQAEAVIAELAEAALARDWRHRMTTFATVVEHAAGDHPALGSVRAGETAHLLSLDPGLTDASTNVRLQRWVNVSVRSPAAFARIFDPAALYESQVGDQYPGPDRDPRG